MVIRAKQRSLIAIIGGAGTAMIGIAALVGWLIGRMSLAGAVAGYTPSPPGSRGTAPGIPSRWWG
ncbi:MAG: hypothetical protein H0X64_10535 [Gemmatimonadaceae bacterium]|nr:hypothetical protein [Gemmatimonadaceae bacterium]